MQTIHQVADKVTETVTPVLEKAVVRGAPVLASAIEGVISVTERIDPDASQRQAVFKDAAKADDEATTMREDVAPVEEEQKQAEDDTAQAQAPTADALQRLKVVTEDLLDLWLYEGSKGLRYVQASKAYQLTDPYVHYVDKFEAVKSKSVELKASLEQIPKKVVLYYDEATNFVGMLIRVLNERQEEIVAYVRRTYSNVQVFMQDNYLRLDFNKDGTVDMDDLRESLVQFYDFLKSFDYIATSTRITSTLYDQAVNIMKRGGEADQQAAAEGGAESQVELVEIAANAESDLVKKENEQKASQDDLVSEPAVSADPQ